jgi:hypothetical protein
LFTLHTINPYFLYNDNLPGLQGWINLLLALVVPLDFANHFIGVSQKYFVPRAVQLMVEILPHNGNSFMKCHKSLFNSHIPLPVPCFLQIELNP